MYFVGTDTRFYDEETPEVRSQKYSRKESEIEKSMTFTWDDVILTKGVEHHIWAKLVDISATIVKRSDSTCVVNFSLEITSFSHRTDNNPDGKDNPPLILMFKNKSGGILITINIETEPYSSHIYHGLTVRCNYSHELKGSSYEVGVAPYDEIENASLRKPGGRPIYQC